MIYGNSLSLKSTIIKEFNGACNRYHYMNELQKIV